MDEANSQQGELLFLERTFDALPEQVFAAWTNPRLLEQWWGPPGTVVKVAEIDFRVGGRYRLGVQRPGQVTYFVSGIYQNIQPPHKLAFTWRWENADMDIGSSLVTLEFRANGNKTDLRLTHAQLSTKEARIAHSEGWVGILEKLARFLSD
ncbi:MAG: SRPBCC domain-containing protein [Chloroflexi bacterium]|nr:SRPBCC domain-containing protein [Chloroflexota bacterium]